MKIKTYKKVIRKCKQCGEQILIPRNGENENCSRCIEKKINSKLRKNERKIL